ncbi:metal-dependent hydrolase [bacterium]|nr:metal-dependent hydrolase [bacterium]
MGRRLEVVSGTWLINPSRSRNVGSSGVDMDPLSQAVLGSVASQSVRNKTSLIRVGTIGALAGMAPDLDVLIQSATDPLLSLEYHRQFTHSLIFIPLGAALCALVFWPFVRRHMSYRQVWLVALVGYATHGLLDACTTYGTMLLWPFSDARIAWSNISVVDPLFTLPLLAAVVLAGTNQSALIARLGMLWGLLYLAFGLVQQDRATTAGEVLAASRGHDPVAISAKPSFGNILLWKVIYEHNDRYYVDAVRVTNGIKLFEGDNVARLNIEKHFPWLRAGSQQAKDLERFRWFARDYLAVDEDDSQFVVDIRYSLLPNEIRGLWGIRLDATSSQDQHVEWTARRSAGAERFDELLGLLAGRDERLIDLSLPLKREYPIIEQLRESN